ncbi:hypothetical protein [Rhizobium sp. Leaf386]|nr:hypothetical protein [Rhizobium sp. Leaf386]
MVEKKAYACRMMMPLDCGFAWQGYRDDLGFEGVLDPENGDADCTDK